MAQNSDFSLTSLIRGLQRWFSEGIKTPGGWIGPQSAISSPQLLIAALGGKEITENGQVRTSEHFIHAMTPQITETTQSFQPLSDYLGLRKSTILTPTQGATPSVTTTKNIKRRRTNTNTANTKIYNNTTRTSSAQWRKLKSV